MSWTETFHCDVCSKAKSEGSGDWWLAWLGTTAGEPGAQDESMLKMTGWNQVLSHSAEVRHLCGARCAQTLMDRWMQTAQS
jgi:hypothetical protein